VSVSELRRLRQLEEENSRLKRLVGDLSLDKHMLSEALRKKSKAHTSLETRHLLLSLLGHQGSSTVTPCGYCIRNNVSHAQRDWFWRRRIGEALNESDIFTASVDDDLDSPRALSFG